MTRFYSHAHINPATMDAADDAKQIAWLVGLSGDEYAALADAFFGVDKHAEHFQAFLRDTREAYELATGSRDDE